MRKRDLFRRIRELASSHYRAIADLERRVAALEAMPPGAVPPGSWYAEQPLGLPRTDTGPCIATIRPRAAGLDLVYRAGCQCSGAGGCAGHPHEPGQQP